jgi:hypothetical protein
MLTVIFEPNNSRTPMDPRPRRSVEEAKADRMALAQAKARVLKATMDSFPHLYVVAGTEAA